MHTRALMVLVLIGCAEEAPRPAETSSDTSTPVEDPAPSAGGLVCAIVEPRMGFAAPGRSVRFAAVARDAAGALVPGQRFIWATSDPAIAVPDLGPAPEIRVHGGPTPGGAQITCRIEGGEPRESAPVAVRNDGPPGPGQARAVIVDRRSGLPVAGATVSWCAQGVCAPAITGAEGVSTRDGLADGESVDVHVFHEDYGWLSVLGTRSRDLLLPVEPLLPPVKVRGTLDASAAGEGTVLLGFGGTSGWRDPSTGVQGILGASEPVRIKLGTLFDEEVQLPAGLVLQLGDTVLKGTFSADAEPGARLVWGLGSKIAFDALLGVLEPVLHHDGLLPKVSAFQMLTRLSSTSLRHGALPMPLGEGSDPAVAVALDRPLPLSTSLTIGPLPVMGSSCPTEVVALAGASVPGLGVVPLGFAGASTPDCSAAELPLWFAEAHAGMEGAPQVVAALALGPSGAESGVLARPGDGVPAALALGDFLPIPAEASFNPSTRVFALGAPAGGATAYRAEFRAGGKSWTVWFPPGRAGWTLPVPPSVDRAVAGGSTALRLVALRTNGGFDDLPSGGLGSLADAVLAYSATDCAPGGSCAP